MVFRVYGFENSIFIIVQEVVNYLLFFVNMIRNIVKSCFNSLLIISCLFAFAVSSLWFSVIVFKLSSILRPSASSKFPVTISTTLPSPLISPRLCLFLGNNISTLTFSCWSFADRLSIPAFESELFFSWLIALSKLPTPSIKSCRLILCVRYLWDCVILACPRFIFSKGVLFPKYWTFKSWAAMNANL